MSTESPKHDLKKVRVKLTDLRAFEGNARRGDIEAIAQSLAELGQFRTIVVNKGTHTGRANEVLAGNHTVQAANLIDMTHLDATFVDVDDDTAKKIVLADNRTNDLATYDDVALAELLESLGADNLAGTGFTEDDYDDILDTNLLPPPIEVPTTGKGTGTAAISESIVWGYVTWASTRVLITKAEVEALDKLFKRFTTDRGTDVGFGWLLAGESEAPPELPEKPEKPARVKRLTKAQKAAAALAADAAAQGDTEVDA